MSGPTGGSAGGSAGARRVFAAGERAVGGEELEVCVELVDDTSRIRVRGELDAGTGPRLWSVLQRVLLDSPDVVVDLNEVAFVDLVAIGGLVRARVDADRQGTQLRFVVGPALRRVASLTGDHALLDPPRHQPHGCPDTGAEDGRARSGPMTATRCDLRRAAWGPDAPPPGWATAIGTAVPLRTAPCRRVVVVTAHLDEELCAVGGLLARLAGRHPTVDVLAVTDGDGDSAAVDRTTRRRRLQPQAYAALGFGQVRRHRLNLQSANVAAAEVDIVAAVSELVGYDRPRGVWCLSPWHRDGHPDHDAAGRAAAIACQGYGVRLARYLITAWSRSDLPPPPPARLRTVALPPKLLARKTAALGRQVARRVADREVLLV